MTKPNNSAATKNIHSETSPALRASRRSLFWIGILGLGLFGSYAKADQIASQTATVLLNTEVSNRYSIAISSPVISASTVNTNEGTFDYLAIEGEGKISVSGWPDLPSIDRTFLIPPQGGVHLQVNGITTRDESGIHPVVAPPADCDDYLNSTPANDYLDYEGWFPEQPIVIDAPAIFRGYRLVTVHTFPIQFNPKTGVTRFNEDLNFDLNFSGVGINEVADPFRIPPSYSVKRALEGMVVNPPNFPLRDDILTGNYLYVVPNFNGLDAVLEPLLEWRRQMGHNVAVAHLNNNANPASVLDAITTAYRSDFPPEFVCLVGDAAGGQFNISAATQFGDYEYTRLDGNDPLPDVAIGRISVASLDQLRSAVTKIVTYESNPYMENTDWYSQAYVVAGHQGNGIGEVHLAHWVRMQLEEYGFDEVRGWYWNVDGEASGNQQFLTDAFRWGISILHYRAFSHMNQLNPAVLQNLPNQEGRWPAVLAISCNTGNFVSETNGNYNGVGMTEDIFRARGGGIGAIGTATPNTNVRFNNLVAAGVWRGVYQLRMYCLGWGLNQGKYEIWRAYHGFDNEYSSFMDWNNLIGDPGTSIWTDVPMRVNVTYPERSPISSNLVLVDVVDEDNGDPVEGAQVCIYRTNSYQIVGITDETGHAVLTMPDDLEPGEADLTVVKHNVFPFQDVITFTEPADRLAALNFGIDDDDQDGTEGNGDGTVNPGELVALNFALGNTGQNDIQGGAEINVISLSPFAEVIDDVISFDDCPAAGEAIDGLAMLQLAPDCPNGELVRIEFDIQADGQEWHSIAEFEISAPKIALQRVIIDDNQLAPGEIKTLNVQIINNGQIDLDQSTATLVSSCDAVTVIDDVSTYPRIAINGSRTLNGRLFRVRCHPATIPGTRGELTLLVETESGFRDLITFNLVLGQPGDGDPFGPDSYGYVCFDSEDDEWVLAPQYDWVEINPAIQGRDYVGTVLNLTDTGDNLDKSLAINMPWDFQYYGSSYRQLTVCTNGWAAFGDQHTIGNFRNQHIGQALGPEAILAVWWDNLITVANSSAIVTYNDRDNGRFIIEWSQMRRLLDGGGAGAVETFEIILYDPAVYETLTGDGIITYQYLNVTNENRIAHNDLPYCTIGIGSPDGFGGLEYSYWNTFSPGATPIASEMAITFTTQSTTRTGVIQGIITDVETGNPIPDGQVLTTGSYWAQADHDGHYIIDDILVGEDYALTASALGWNDSTLTGFDVVEDETLHVDFALLHPEIRFSVDHFEEVVDIGDVTRTTFSISNDGNGILTWRSEPKVIQDDEPPIWEPQYSLNIAQIVEDDRIEGVVCTGENFYFCGANGDFPNTVYVVSHEGALVDTFAQAGTSRYGYKDMAWDGQYLWASGEDTIFGFTKDGEVIARLDGPQSPNSSLAFDTDRSWIWASGITTNITAIDLDGNRVGRAIPRNGLRIYGLAYHPQDIDGKNLYIQTREAVTDRQIIYRVNPLEGDPELYHVLEPEEPGTPSSFEISGLFDPRNWSILSMQNLNANEGGDRLDVYQLDPRTDWMSLEPGSGTLNPGDEQEITLELRAQDLPEILLSGDLNFIHNSIGGSTSIPILLEIVPGVGNFDDRVWSLAAGWNLVSLNIEPLDDDIIALMSPLVELNALTLIKDGHGRFYSPANGFNSIPFYDPTQGYQIYMADSASLEITGINLNPGSPIPLGAGWNMIAYFPRQPADAEIAYAGLADNLVIAKDIGGRFYMPAYGFNGLGTLGEGNGYQLKVRNAVDLIYQWGDEGGAFQRELSITHFSDPEHSNVNHSLLLIGNEAMAGYEAAVVRKDGNVSGIGVFNGRGFAGVAIWGDNPATNEVEGLLPGEEFIVRFWDGVTESGADLNVTEGDKQWAPDGITVATLSSPEIPCEFGLQSAYPNPFNSSTRITFGISQSGFADLGIYDLVGRKVRNLVSEDIKAGRHSVIWSGEAVPSGIYFVRLESAGSIANQKIALIR